MPESTLGAPAAGVQNKIDQTHKVLGIVSTSLGILGAAGTLLVGLVMNFYVGDVEILPDRPMGAVVVKVYDNKGHEAVFHCLHFQMMPGNYSLDILPDGGKSIHADVNVQFRENSLVPVVVPAGEPQSTGEAASASDIKRHWWQFWRR